MSLAEWMNGGAQDCHQKTVNELEQKMGIVPNSCEYYVRVYDSYPTDKNPRAFLVDYDREQVADAGGGAAYRVFSEILSS